MNEKNNDIERRAAQYPGLTLYRVISQEKGLYRIAGEAGEREAVVAGKLQYQARQPSDYPAVGDYVMADPGQGRGMIQAVLERKSVLMRKTAGSSHAAQMIAANVDTVFVCMSLNNDLNPRRLERYLTVCWEGGAAPVVVLTKSDLCEDLDAALQTISAVTQGADIIVTSARAADGCQRLLPYLRPGVTVAFTGSSGVGKSTLMNRLLGEERQATGGLRNDDRGHHTTTRRELFWLPNGAAIIDTPGLREMGLMDASEGLETAFADVQTLINQCRFRNCTHQHEPGCAVRAALANGQLSQERWQSWQKLTAESLVYQGATEQRSAKEKNFKQIARQNRYNSKR